MALTATHAVEHRPDALLRCVALDECRASRGEVRRRQQTVAAAINGGRRVGRAGVRRTGHERDEGGEDDDQPGGTESVAAGAPANCPGVIAVGALRHVGTKAGYSSLGSAVAISAPGGNCGSGTLCAYSILSTVNDGTTTAGNNTYSDGTNYAIGTSFAAPMVSGTAALMLSLDSSLTPASVKSLLQSSARTFPTSGGSAGIGTCQAPSGSTEQDECYCTTSTCGAGMLDASAALSAVAALTPPTASIRPSN